MKKFFVIMLAFMMSFTLVSAKVSNGTVEVTGGLSGPSKTKFFLEADVEEGTELTAKAYGNGKYVDLTVNSFNLSRVAMSGNYSVEVDHKEFLLETVDEELKVELILLFERIDALEAEIEILEAIVEEEKNNSEELEVEEQQTDSLLRTEEPELSDNEKLLASKNEELVNINSKLFPMYEDKLEFYELTFKNKLGVSIFRFFEPSKVRLTEITFIEVPEINNIKELETYLLDLKATLNNQMINGSYTVEEMAKIKAANESLDKLLLSVVGGVYSDKMLSDAIIALTDIQILLGDIELDNSKDPVDTKPTEETKPSETKPSETKPNETKPSETKPSETKPSINTPVTGLADSSMLYFSVLVIGAVSLLFIKKSKKQSLNL